MSSSALKLLAASGAKGGATYVDDVFSTFLYDGTGAAQTITNNIDFSGEGGLTWIKSRTHGGNHNLIDTVRGSSYVLESDGTGAQGTNTGQFTFNNNGFTINNVAAWDINQNNQDYASWSFRKQPGFFDVVTYTGNGANRTIAHNLGSVPGMIIVKRTSAAEDWTCYHRAIDSSSPQNYYINLNKDNARDTLTGGWNNTAPTSTAFTVGNHNRVNGNGHTYVAYIFAHDAQDFGTDSDEAIIKCGSYTGNGSTTGPIIDLGFEPQWLLFKNATSSSNWSIYDVMRGITFRAGAGTGDDQELKANTSDAETASGVVNINPNGFQLKGGQTSSNANGATHIYMAIRRPFKPAEEFAATDLFAVDSSNSTGNAPPQFYSGFPVDMSIKVDLAESEAYRYRETRSRLAPGRLKTNAADAEVGSNPNFFDMNDGVYGNTTVSTNHVAWMWRRAPGSFDVVAYTGNSVTGSTVAHNLGAVPEMMWIKQRDNGTENWRIYADVLGPTKGLWFADYMEQTEPNWWNSTRPTNAVFTLGGSSSLNNNGTAYIAYLFASVDGISKVGTYTGAVNAVNVDCGFSAGARFVLIKRTDGSGDWYLWDSLRGIVAGNDPYLLLNTAAAQVTNTDYIDPLASGFTVTSSAPAAINGNGGTYFFYAIA